MNNFFYHNMGLFIIILYIGILYFINLKDKDEYLLIITLCTIFLLLKVREYKNKNIIEGNEDYPLDNVTPTPNPSLTDIPEIEDLTNRIKILEELMALKKWSSAQSYEITELQDKLNALKSGETADESQEDTIVEEVYDGEITHASPPPISHVKEIEPMGTYDGLCLTGMVKENKYELMDGESMDTYLGHIIPLKLDKTDGVDEGPSIDGDRNSPKRLTIMERNKSSISCCDSSPFFTSTGCVCLTKGQEDFITKRGGNHIHHDLNNLDVTAITQVPRVINTVDSLAKTGTIPKDTRDSNMADIINDDTLSKEIQESARGKMDGPTE